MRYLNRVAAHEIFVASGTYRYQRDDTMLAVAEHFTIHEFEGGAMFYRVDEDGRDEDGLTILSEALLSPEGKLERFNVQSYNPDDDALKLFKANYVFEPDYVQITQRIAGEDSQASEFELMDGCQLYIKQTLYMGLTIRDILVSGGTANVFTPQLLSVGNSQLQKIIVEHQGEETLQIGNKTIATTKYQIADDVFYWLDEHNIPIKRTFTANNAHYTVTISDYAHR